MVKKLKALAETTVDSNLAATVRESAHQIWLAGLGAFAKAQEEGNKVFEALVKEGETLQARTRAVAEDKVTDITARAVGTWDRLEKVFEDRVGRALGALGVPTRQDIDALSKRVVELTAVVNKLTGELGEAPKKTPARRSAVKKAVAK